MKHDNMAGAIAAAMEDYLDNGSRFSPHNPAICRNQAGRYYYGSALHGEAVFKLECGGFGNWTPTNPEEIEIAANGMAAEIGNSEND